MLTRLCLITSICFLFFLAQSQAAGVIPIRGPVDVSIEVIVNPVKGPSPPNECPFLEEVQTYSKKEWWITAGQTKPHPQKVWEGLSNRIRCRSGAFEKARADTGKAIEIPYLIADLSTVASLSRGTLDQRILRVKLAIYLQKLSGFENGGQPVYQQSVVNREFFFSETRDTFVPLLVASAKEQEALGINEIFLRIVAGRAGERSAASYGVVSVTSGLEGAEILLDGGLIGKISEGGETILKNVPAGLREVRVRDASGNEVRKVVRVEANRTVLFDLSLADPADGTVAYRLVPLGSNTQGYEEYRRETDGAVVVKIPAGEFLMGNRETERAPLEHRVYVSEFLIDKTGVTWGQYKKFAAATGIPLPPHDPYWGIHDNHPAVYVTWEEAKAYCEWAGGRLPTEAEREKAARGTDGRKYPWGDEEPDPQRGVYRRTWGYEATGAVGTHPAGASPYGLLDMGGNVWEWCSDWYDDGYFAVSPYRNPKGPPYGRAHVVRGGSWDSRPTVLSSSCRNWGYRGYREGDFGFRCAMNAPQ